MEHELFYYKSLKKLSSKKARLIVTNNFKYLTYYNLYNRKQAIKSNEIQNNYSSKLKRKSYFFTNNKSLLYSSIYKQNTLFTTKNRDTYLLKTYPLFMKSFLINNSSLNYFNNYDIYNIKSNLDGLLSFNKTLDLKYNKLKSYVNI